VLLILVTVVIPTLLLGGGVPGIRRAVDPSGPVAVAFGNDYFTGTLYHRVPCAIRPVIDRHSVVAG